jgi:two-component system NtrC family sensor kinase
MILVILIVSFTPSILIGGPVLYQIHNSYAQKVRDHMTTLLLEYASHIDAFLNEKIGNIKLLANSYDMENLGDQRLSEDLELLHWAYGRDIETLSMINQHGRQLVHAGPNYVFDADQKMFGWFQKAIKKYQYVSDIFEESVGSFFFFVSVKKTAINDSNDQQSWVLRAGMNAMVFQNKLRSLKTGETGNAYIYDRKGEFLGKRYSGVLPAQKIREGLIQKEKKNVRGVYVGQLDHDGQNVFIAATYIQNSGWLLVFQQNVSEAFSKFRSAGIIIGIICFFWSLGIFFTVIAVTRKMAGGLKEANRQQVRITQGMVEAGNLASIGELAAGIAHEINNPVAIMIESAGWAKDLIREGPYEKTENYDEILYSLNQIKEQGLRCKSVTQKLLSFGRRGDSIITDLHIDELVEDVIMISTQRAIYSGIKIHNELQTNLPLIRASRTELEQVFLNLINNAIDAMEVTGGTLTISGELNTSQLCIKFTDTGSGIPPETLNRIFNPFFTTKPVGKGSGLGLSICYGIIEKMGGQIIVQSTLGEETSFIVKLPCEVSGNKKNEEIQIQANFGL